MSNLTPIRLGLLAFLLLLLFRPDIARLSHPARRLLNNRRPPTTARPALALSCRRRAGLVTTSPPFVRVLPPSPPTPMTQRVRLALGKVQPTLRSRHASRIW
ncbi:hypothetical protein FRC08_012799 [Ceratobasidium sp. 394]|nr:hypothetical protein FRC08_012799 [Ceratobasidium sp. 394]KAG9076795.1 hypothetical protein FS749_011376 [Ceratobasidium sp. UAMH 11750]